MSRPRRVALAALLPLLLLAPTARSGGGARNVLLVVNEASEESLEIGGRYLRARDIPAENVCRLDTSTAFTVSQAVYQDEIEQPILDCIAASPNAGRIDYLVLTRGLPIRARFPDASAPPTQPVSITELLRVMDTPLRGKDQEYGAPYGFQFHPNPYRGRREAHSHAKLFGGYNLYAATMLAGYWSEHAVSLIENSLASDLNPPHAAPGAAFYLEESTDPGSPANTRNAGIPAAVANLQARGIPAVHVAGSDPDVTGAAVASHLNAGSYSSISRADIVSNSYPPGALVCALESFGLVPNNFDPDAGSSQTPVTWWIEAGATGGHGTVAEPYNVAFPSAALFAPYVEGYNLAETYYQGIPYLYWMNLVLGDPLAAPYATPPTVTVVTPAGGDRLSGSVRFEATAATPVGGGIASMEFFVDQVPVHAEPDGDGWLLLDTTAFADGSHRLEVVAFEGTARETQGRASVDVIFDNASLQLSIDDPLAGAVVAGVFDVTISGSPALVDVSLEAFGAVLGTATGPPPWTIAADSARLGRGLADLQARGSDGATSVLSAAVEVQVAKPARLHAITPAEGPETGGTALSLTGWNFEPGARVFVAGSEAASVVRIDANRLSFSTPPGPVGSVDVTIEGLGLSASFPGAFTYLPVCPGDADGDTVCDDVDNCPDTPNPAQEDADGDGIGDACAGCSVEAEVTDLRVARAPGLGLLLTWSPSADACLAGYEVLAATDAGRPPADYTSLTDRDLDGDPGGDATFTGPTDPGVLSFLRVASVGTDGTLGP